MTDTGELGRRSRRCAFVFGLLGSATPLRASLLLAGMFATGCGGAGVTAAQPPRRPRPAKPRPAMVQAKVEPEAPVPGLCRLPDVFATDALDISEGQTDTYVVPDEARRQALHEALSALAVGAIGSATEAARRAQYEVCTDGSVAMLRPLDRTGQARIAVHLRPNEDLILEAPHPFFDFGTLEQARQLFDLLEARALIASGTHRCASTAAGCEGRSNACGEPGGFRMSDAAHAVNGTFHTAHIALGEAFPSAHVVSLHGHRESGVRISNGTTFPVDSESPVTRLVMALRMMRVRPISACNPGARVPLRSRLCGTTNVQGRQLNGSPDACEQAAPEASGRFIHFEQGRHVRARTPDLARAFRLAFHRWRGEYLVPVHEREAEPAPRSAPAEEAGTDAP